MFPKSDFSVWGRGKYAYSCLSPDAMSLGPAHGSHTEPERAQGQLPKPTIHAMSLLSSGAGRCPFAGSLREGTVSAAIGLSVFLDED